MRAALAWCRNNPRDFAAAWFFLYRLAWAIYWSTVTPHPAAFLFSLRFQYGWTPILCSALVAGALGYRWGRTIADGAVNNLAGAAIVGMGLQLLSTVLYIPLAVLLTMPQGGDPFFAQFVARVYFSYVFSLAGVPVHLLLGAITGGGLFVIARLSRRTTSGIQLPAVISEDESLYKDAAFFVVIAFSMGWPFWVGKAYENKLVSSLPTSPPVQAQKPPPPVRPVPAGASSLPQAYEYVRIRDWQRALDASRAEIQIHPQSAEAYHLAGLAAGQVYGLYSKESRDYYAKFVEFEPDIAKKAFVKQIFPDLIP